MDTEQKPPQLDPKTELPNPHDMLLNAKPLDAQLMSEAKDGIPAEKKKHFPKWLLVALVIALTLALLIGGTFINGVDLGKKQSHLDTISPTSATARPTLKEEMTEWKFYKNTEHHLSFQYPSTWIVQEEPIASPLGKVSIINIAHIYPQQTAQGTTDINPLIQLHYYPNPEELSIEEFNDKYLSKTVAGDPVSIWAPSYEKVTNPQGLNAFYDKEHYCVAVCKIYVWAQEDKIYVLKNFPDSANHFPAIENQDEIFHKIFSTITIDEQKPTFIPSAFPTQTLKPDPTGLIYCTADALECPDGSFVSRQGPKCEFTPCPPMP